MPEVSEFPAQHSKSHSHLKLSLVLVLLAIHLADTRQLNAQQEEEIRGFNLAPRNIVLNTLDAPRGRSRLITNTTWGEIDVTIQALPEDIDPRIDYISELVVKIHWLTPEPSPNDLDFKERQALSLEQTFFNIKPSRQMAFVAYIPPDWLERFGGVGRFRTGSNIAVEVIYKGKNVIQTEFRERGNRAGDDPDWFKAETKKGILLPIQQTPWMMENWDRYYRPQKWSEM